MSLIHAGTGSASSSDGWNRHKGTRHGPFLFHFSLNSSVVIWNFRLGSQVDRATSDLKNTNVRLKDTVNQVIRVSKPFLLRLSATLACSFLIPNAWPSYCSWGQAGTSASILFCCVLFWVSLRTYTSKFPSYTQRCTVRYSEVKRFSNETTNLCLLQCTEVMTWTRKETSVLSLIVLSPELFKCVCVCLFLAVFLWPFLRNCQDYRSWHFLHCSHVVRVHTWWIYLNFKLTKFVYSMNSCPCRCSVKLIVCCVMECE